VLERACLDCGFDIDSGRLLVQVFPSRRGGCEMFVTRVAQKNEKEGRGEALVCLLDSPGSMLALCRTLKARGMGAESSAYLIGDKRYALVLPELDRDAPLPLNASVLCEFGEICNNENLEGYINEHARVIFSDDAVARLAEFC
jgi:negative regulator of genetic competence, sporulation and motility